MTLNSMSRRARLALILTVVAFVATCCVIAVVTTFDSPEGAPSTPAPSTTTAPLHPVRRPTARTLTMTARRLDPRFDSCAEAISHGYGPYQRGQTEYGWYRDSDGDGVTCER